MYINIRIRGVDKGKVGLAYSRLVAAPKFTRLGTSRNDRPLAMINTPYGERDPAFRYASPAPFLFSLMYVLDQHSK